MPPTNTIRQPSSSTGVAILFITVGVLMAIWSAVWWTYLGPEDPTWKSYVCTGLFLSGGAILTIGILVGRIGREAQQGDVPVGQVASPPVAAAAPAPPATAQAPVPSGARPGTGSPP